MYWNDAKNLPWKTDSLTIFYFISFQLRCQEKSYADFNEFRVETRKWTDFIIEVVNNQKSNLLFLVCFEVNVCQ